MYIYFTEKEIITIQKKQVKWKLFRSQLRNFTPLFLMGNLLAREELIFIFSAIQIILGPNNANIASVMMNLIIGHYGDKNSQYIFIIYILYNYLFLLSQYFSFNDVQTTSMEKIAIFFSLAMFINYFFNQKINLFIPVLFLIYSLVIVPATLTANNKKIEEEILKKDCGFYEKFLL